MTKFTISGNLYMTQEYDYTYTIEAETPEEAAEQFRSLMESGRLPRDLEVNEVDRPFDRSGTFNVFSEEADCDEFMDPDEYALVSYETFGE